jgi:O-methyltransferase involved in polyketide biosynthesis
MYLTPDGVEATLRKVASCARGSMIAFDYFTDFVLQSKSAYMRYARAATRMSGEPLRFGFDSTPPVRDRVAEKLEACGLRLQEHRVFGDESLSRRAWGGFALAVV